MKDSRLSGVTVNRLSLQGTTVSNTRLDGCIMTDVQLIDSEIGDCAFRGSSLLDSEIGTSRLKDSRFEAIGFANLRIQNSELRNVSFRDSFDGRIAPQGREPGSPRRQAGQRSVHRLHLPGYDDQRDQGGRASPAGGRSQQQDDRKRRGPGKVRRQVVGTVLRGRGRKHLVAAFLCRVSLFEL